MENKYWITKRQLNELINSKSNLEIVKDIIKNQELDAKSENKKNNSHSSEEKCAGAEKETKPVETPREKELSRQGSHEPSLTSPRDTLSGEVE